MLCIPSRPGWCTCVPKQRSRYSRPLQSLANPYKVLQISEDADPSQIKRAYRKLALKHHPDTSEHPSAEQEFLRIQEAYEILTKKRDEAHADPAGNSWDFHDWYWDFMTTSRWDSHWKKHGRAGPSPFAATPSHRNQWLAQLGRLKQKAAFRKAKQQAQQQSQSQATQQAQQQSESEATQQQGPAAQHEPASGQQQSQPAYEATHGAQTPSRPAQLQPEALDDKARSHATLAEPKPNPCEAAEVVQQQQQRHDCSNVSPGKAYEDAHQQKPAHTMSAKDKSEPADHVDLAQVSQHHYPRNSWRMDQHGTFQADSCQQEEQHLAAQQQQQQQEQAQLCSASAQAHGLDRAVGKADLQSKAQRIGTAVLDRSEIPSLGAAANPGLGSALDSPHSAHAEGHAAREGSAPASEKYEGSAIEAESSSQYSHQSEGSFATATDRVQSQLAGLRRRAARKSQQ